MKLKGVLISQLKDLKNYFSFDELWKKISLFLIECSPQDMQYSDKEAKLFTIIYTCMNEESDVKSVYTLTEDGTILIGMSDKVELEFVKYDSAILFRKELEENSREHNTENIYYAVLALHELGGRGLDDISSMIEGICKKAGEDNIQYQSRMQESKTTYSDQTILAFDNQDTPYIIKQYDHNRGNSLQISTKKLWNSSKSAYGCATIHIVGKDDVILYTLQLKYDDSVYANFIGDQIVEVLPTISCGELHYIYLTKDDNGKDTLGKYVFATEQASLYPSTELQGITQFIATDDKGFVGIVAGSIITYTSTPFSLDYPTEETPVCLYVRGSSYLLLTNRGNTYSNINFNHKGIISIHFDEYYNAYAITAEGKVLSSNKQFQSLNRFSDIFMVSAYHHKLALGTLGSDLICVDTSTGFTEESKKSQLMNIKMNSKGSYAVRNNRVEKLDCDKELLMDVREFDLTDDYIVGRSERNINCLELDNMKHLKSVNCR